MKIYKALTAGLALASLLAASAASAQTATTSTTVGVGGPDLAVSITQSGIMLDASNSSVPISVSSLPVSIGGAIGASCQLTNAGASLGTIGSGSSFITSVIVPAGSSVTLPITCTGATPGSYTVSIATSLIPATVEGTNQAITPRGIGGGSDHDTTAVGTITVGSGGTVTGITGSGTGSTGSSVLGTSTTQPNVPAPASTGVTSTSGSGSAVLGTSTTEPSVPNTGAGGDAGTTFAVLLIAGLAAIGGTLALRRVRA